MNQRFRTWASLFTSLLVTGCSFNNVTGKEVGSADRYGMMAVSRPVGWYDDTQRYLRLVSSVRRDPAIQSLLLFARDDGRGYCKFRSLRYLATEQGFYWEARKIAEGLSDLKNDLAEKTELIDYLKRGFQPKKNSKKIKSIEIEESSFFQFGKHAGWKFKHGILYETAGLMDEAISITFALPYEYRGAGYPKYYLSAECLVFGDRRSLPSMDKEIERMISTVELFTPIDSAK